MTTDYLGKEINNYRVVTTLGVGGFGSVYLAEHKFLDKRVAIKALGRAITQGERSGSQPIDREFNELLLEARRTSTLIHPHIIRTLDFGIDVDGIPYLIMDYAPNGSLRQRHRKGEKLALSTVVSYVKQIADALQYMHNQKLIHRDVKPENLLLGEQDEILLSDLGIAVHLDDEANQRKSNVAGTPLYMAPEQWQGSPTPASDQYALATMTYEWLCGRLPFPGGSVHEIASHHLQDTPPPLREIAPKISPLIEFVVLTALSKEQGHRFATVKGFAHALENASEQAEISGLRSIERPIDRTFRNLPTVAAPVFIPPTVPAASQSPYVPSQAFEKSGASNNDLEIENHPISLFTVTHHTLELGDKALVGKSYTFQAGISKTAPEYLNEQPFEITVNDMSKTIVFDISLRVSENIELLTEWYQYLTFNQSKSEPQFVDFVFRIEALGESFVIVDFYHEQRWLKRIKHEFQSVSQSEIVDTSLEEM